MKTGNSTLWGRKPSGALALRHRQATLLNLEQHFATSPVLIVAIDKNIAFPHLALGHRNPILEKQFSSLFKTFFPAGPWSFLVQFQA